jgi:UDP:flavonoid glycosyltransferase YjiC (YdhE family)
VLASSTGGAGHFGPLVPFLDALARRGDEVLLAVPRELESTVEPMGHPFVLGPDPPADQVSAIMARIPAVSRSEAAILGNRELFGRLCTTAMLPTVERACREWRPDLVLHEAAEYASAIAAERCGIAHAQVAISLAEVEAASLDIAAPALAAFDERIVDLVRASPFLTRFPASLDPSPYSVTRRCRDRPAASAEPLPDWWGASTAPLIYVSFGSVAGRLPITATAYRTALEAVAGFPARVLLTVGRAAAIDIGDAPANAHVEAWVPQRDVLPEAALVVAHGGSGTTFGALAMGVPLVIVPLFADQPVNAERVAASGAALVVEPSAGSGRLRAAIEEVLGDPSYRRAARAIADEMRAYPSTDELLGTLTAPVRHAPAAPRGRGS